MSKSEGIKTPPIMPEYKIEVFNISLSTTLVTSIVATVFFVFSVLLYNFLNHKNEDSLFVNIFNLGIEKIYDFFNSVVDNVPRQAKMFSIFIFIYFLRVNLFGLLGDLFAISIPSLHHWFRPVATDIIFNGVLAIVGVFRAVCYGFYSHGFHYVEKYLPYKGIGLVKEVNSVGTFFGKIFDIFIGLFVGLLEFVSEFTKIISLTLRLFGNIFAGVVIITFAISFVPLLFPLVVIIFEAMVSVIQAFIFAILVLIYFKMAETVH